MTSPYGSAEDGNDLLGDTDALHWAERFVQIAVEYPQVALDTGLMTVWFAAAIMTGQGKQRAEFDARLTRVRRQIAVQQLTVTILLLAILVNIILLIWR